MRSSCLAVLLLVGVVCSADLNDNKVSKIEGSYIVVLRDGADLEGTIAHGKKLVDSNGHDFNVFRRYHAALNGFAVKMSATAASLVSRMPDVKYVEQDSVGTIDVASTSWGLDRVDQRDLPLDSNFDIQGEGEGVTVYVLDTGIRDTHVEFGGRVVHGGDFVEDGWNGTDCHGHGTHCAGTAAGGIHGIARKANIVSVRLFNCRGSGDLSGTLAGIDHVIQTANHPAVMSMSFGYLSTESLDESIARAVDSGIMAVASAGNDNFDACNKSPAGETKAITVGASDIRDRRASFSNHGPCVDIFAPGVDIVSSSSASDDAIAIWSGTSMAAPHVAGVVAILLGNGVPAPDVPQRLLDDSSLNKIYFNKYLSANKLLYVD